LNNNSIPGNGAAGNSNSNSSSRRDREERWQNAYANNNTGALPPVNNGRGYQGTFDFDEMISSLRELFAHDRQVASQSESRRCGICYLYSNANELHYREEEGFYICASCEQALGKHVLPMLRRQQK
jgi:hypothetical protein